MAKGRASSVRIPTAGGNMFELAENIYTKHLNDGLSSLLNHLDGVSWNEVGPQIEKVKAMHEEASALKAKLAQLEHATENEVANLSNVIKASANLLKAVYGNASPKLVEWGFTVNPK